MQHIINPIIQRYYTHSTENLFYHIDSVTVNGEPADYYIGQTGDITCIIHIVALYRDDRYYIKSVFGNSVDSIQIYPSCFFTLHHIKQTLAKQDGVILYIGQYYTKRIVFKHGMYQTCEVLDLWWQVLKDIYGENNVRAFFDAKQDDLITNTYAKNLVEQSVRFYVDMLIRRLRSYNTKGDVFLVSEIVHNEYFMSMFNSSYQQTCQSFVVPVTQMHWLKTYGRSWSPEEIDLQTAANYYV